MKLIAVCGSARKQGNTAKMLHQVTEGAKSVGAETKTVNLFDLKYTDCISCYACKLKGSKSFAHCALNDRPLKAFAGAY
jgi:multimeric flavodoxin WrbA